MGLVEIRRLKYSSRKYYFTVPPDVIETYDLKVGDLLKIGFIEARRETIEQPNDKP